MRYVYFFIFACFVAQSSWAQDFTFQREQMIQHQLKDRGITNTATLRAMKEVSRHLFVPEKIMAYAYWDSPLAIGEGQTISQPYIVAYMTQALKLKKNFRVLEIGTGSGYQAAVLAKIVDSVYTIEIVEPLGLQAKQRLKKLGYDNVEVRIGDGYHGWPEKAPFDAIIVTASIDKIPEALLEQLKDGGRMIIPVGPDKRDCVLRLVRKKQGKYIYKDQLNVAFVPFTRAPKGEEKN